MKITDVILEAANPAQQAAIAIAMKKAGKKPKQGVTEMDKSQKGPPGWNIDDDDPFKKQVHLGPDSMVKKKDLVKQGTAALNRAFKDADKKEPKDVAEDLDPALSEEFDLIESIINHIAAINGVDAEAVWEDLESLTEDELYVFAVTSDPLMEDWQKANKRDKTDGMSQKAVNAYRREHPGSKLKTAVTTKPSKLKKGSKASKRRKSYCSRSRGQMKMHGISCSKTPDKAICKARRRWNC